MADNFGIFNSENFDEFIKEKNYLSENNLKIMYIYHLYKMRHSLNLQALIDIKNFININQAIIAELLQGFLPMGLRNIEKEISNQEKHQLSHIGRGGGKKRKSKLNKSREISLKIKKNKK